jgi:hypothetical protein
MEDSLLVQNDLKRVHISTPLLLAFSMGNATQMGILFYAGQTLSLSGRTPLPVMVGDMSPFIAATYIISIAFVYFLPQYSVRYLRCSTTMELCAALAFSLPLSDRVLSNVFFYTGLCPFYYWRFDEPVRERDSGNRAAWPLRFLRRAGGQPRAGVYYMETLR